MKAHARQESYKARGISRREIRMYAEQVRKKTGTEHELCFPIVSFFEIALPVLLPNFQYEIVPTAEMGNKHGEAFPSQNLIRIREDVYLGAVSGNPRDRFTIAHEIGHLLLHDAESVRLCRAEPGMRLPAFEDPEWQASAFAGELLVPAALIQGMSALEVQQKCGVSYSAAKVQKDALERSKNIGRGWSL